MDRLFGLQPSHGGDSRYGFACPAALQSLFTPAYDDPDILLSQQISCMLQSLEALEETLLPMRKHLHRLLGLPMDRPMLRMANALAFDAAGEAYLLPAQSPESWDGAGVISATLRLPIFTKELLCLPVWLCEQTVLGI